MTQKLKQNILTKLFSEQLSVLNRPNKWNVFMVTWVRPVRESLKPA